ncbi:MAG: glycosyltransferase family 4 protein, partial [Candidatus Limnocylindrales bacterium]
IRHFLLPYATHFRALGWRVDAAANGGRADEVLEEAFDHVYDLPLSRSILDVGRIVRAERAVSALLATGPDIIHVHTPIAGFVTRVAVRRAPTERRPAVVYTAHGFHFYEGGNPASNAAFLMAERLAGRWTDRLVVINTEDEAAALRHRIVPPDRLIRMPGIGVDTRRWSPSSVAPEDIARFREQLRIAAGVPIFLVVGELNRNKRQRDAIAALATMQHKDAQLLLAGQGSERTYLEGLAREQGVRDRVHFLGFVQDLRPVIRAATALILISRREGLARSVMEALALEVPVIASNARGNRELVGSNSGILVNVADVQGLSAAMDQLIDQPEQRRSMGLRGRERMVEGYDVEVLLRMSEDLYQGLLIERGRRAP